MAKVGLEPTASDTAKNKGTPRSLEKHKCLRRARPSGRDSLKEACELAAGWLAFGHPLELWLLIARLVVARGLVGSRCVFVNDAFTIVLGKGPAGCGVRYDLGSVEVTVPSGCALVVERIEVDGREWIAPVCLVEPYAWSVGEWAEYDTETTTRVIATRIMPALEAASMLAEERRPRFRSFAEFWRLVERQGTASLTGGAR